MRFYLRKSGRTRAATLIEVMVTVGMVAVVGLSALLAITFGLYSQQQIHERNGAARIAGEVLGEQRKVLFKDLAPAIWTPEDPRPGGNSIYDHGTPDNDADDTMATVELKFFDKEEIGRASCRERA